ncbi:MAG: amidohydrolase family protein, partial [Gemmatimonadetes bacterium]|nr:amidohydrolase family protein [Gemmatimonadota bacterium]
GWEAWRVPLAGGTPSRITTLAGFTRTSFGQDGRVYFLHQETPGDARLLSLPFPGAHALGLRLEVRSVALDGSDTRVHVSLSALAWPGSEPVLSPDGRWVAYQAGEFPYVAPIPAGPGALPGDSARIPRVEANPNVALTGRLRAFDRGGAYLTWRDAGTLQFASGDRYLTFDAATGRRTITPIALRIARPMVRGAIALRNAKVVTMEGDQVIERGDVVVRNARIVCVGVAGRCDTTGVQRVIDLTGKTIIPGLVDMHAHHTNLGSGVVVPRHRTAALDLAYGVTTILDPSTSSTSAFPLAEMTEVGIVQGPRTFSTAEPVIYPGTSFGDYQILRTQADADHEVDRRVDWGAVSIKNYRQAGRWQQQMLLRAARRRGVTVTSEGGPLYFDVGQVLDGQTGWEHLIANLPVYSDATRFFGAAGATYSPTSIVAGHVAGSKEWFRPRQGLADDAKYQRFAPPDIRRIAARPAPDDPKSTFSFPIIAEGLADIMRAGGHGALGEHGEQPGIGTHWEMWAYAEALRPLEVLRAATIDGARFIGLEREIGSIARGKIADLVILDADPLADIRNSARIAWVMKEGRLL